MDVARLEDRIRWGLNVAARATGATTSAYRPRGAGNPLAASNRYLRLHAAFSGLDGNSPTEQVWRCSVVRHIRRRVYAPGRLHDAARRHLVYRRAAEASARSVRAGQSDIFYPSRSTDATGVNEYGRRYGSERHSFMTNWPASVLVEPRQGRPLANLPNDITVSYWTVLLPPGPALICKVPT